MPLSHHVIHAEAIGPLLRGHICEAYEQIFPLLSDADYARYVAAGNQKNRATPMHISPSHHFAFISQLYTFFLEQNLTFDLVLIRISAPRMHPLPKALLAENVLCSVHHDQELYLDAQPERSTLIISDRFHFKCLDETGDNSLKIELWHDSVTDQVLDECQHFLRSHNIQYKTEERFS